VLVTVLVVGASGVILVQRVSNGLLAAQQRSALAEAAAGRSIARTYADISLESDPERVLDDLVNDLAARAGKPPAYDIVLQPAPGADSDAPLPLAATSLVSGDSVPTELSDALRQEGSTVWMGSDIRYNDDRAEPGLIVGSPVNIRDIGQYELYYLFRIQEVQRAIALVRSTVFGVGAVLVLLLGLLAWWFSRRLVRPVGQAAVTASALATGDLSRRLEVRGEDDMARLAQSFNTMADSLEAQIVRLQELSEMQRRFVADVSHELRTPLTTIRMAAEVLADSVPAYEPKSRRTTELLNSEVERFEVLLGDLLEVSRIDAGEAVVEGEDVDLVVLVAEVLHSLQSLAADHGCRLDQAGARQCRVVCDPRRVGRIVRNLVVNAIEYGAGRPVEVEVAAGATTALVAVTDHGAGLTPDQAEHVFERFWRADPARTRSLGGTGLGLAISREDARLHGGELVVTPTPGRGCVFTLTLPRRCVGSAPAGPRHSASTMG
jgi:two-component system sensor histidine kinase MtrB